MNLSEIAFTHIQKYPNRPTIVFLHDSLGCIDLWRNFPEQLGKLTKCNVLIYDRQGYGKSCAFSYSKRGLDYMEREADLLNELMAFWKLDEVLLFGHSDGGSIALIAAGKYPEKILGIITEGAHVFVEDITIKGIVDAMSLYDTTDFGKKLQKYHAEKTEDMFRAWVDTWTRKPFRKWNIEHFLTDITCPALIIQGEKDEYGTLEQVNSIITQAAGSATNLVIPDVKHTPHKEVPKYVLSESAQFILSQVLKEKA
jgi:pimeloyl-ACP methyl ester carboxylesterase